MSDIELQRCKESEHHRKAESVLMVLRFCRLPHVTVIGQVTLPDRGTKIVSIAIVQYVLAASPVLQKKSAPINGVVTIAP
jgi:hypothetical protein